MRWRSNLVRATLAAAMLAVLLPAAAAADVGPCQLSDATYSWWTHPIAHVAPDGSTHFGSVSSTGEVAARRDCTKTVLELGEADDHDAAAIVTHATKPTIAFHAGHNDRAAVRYRRGETPGEVTFSGHVAYAQVLTYRDRIVLLTRVGGCSWYLARSDDWALTWSKPVEFLEDCAAGGLVYLTTKPHELTPGVFRVAAYGSTWGGIRYGLLNVATGRVSVPGRYAVANILRSSGLPLVRADLAVAYAARAGMQVRLLDVGQVNGQPLIVLSEWSATVPADYVTARYDRDRGWMISRSLPSTGEPFSEPPMYVGGATIADRGDIVLSREVAGTWRIEQYRLLAVSWTRRATLASGSAPLVRPYAVRRGDSVIVQRVARYTDYRRYRTSILELDLKP
jgi:hypothetical protein